MTDTDTPEPPATHLLLHGCTTVLERLCRYARGVPPNVRVEVTIETPDGSLYTAGADLNDPEAPYGWTKQRKNITKTRIKKAIAQIMQYDSIRALDSPTVYRVRVTSTTLLWWTP